MCGRYYVAEEDQTEELQRIIDEAQRRSKESVKTGEVFPSDLAAVVANNRNGEPTPFAMRWGYALPKARIINARSETAADKPLFKNGITQRRCLIPASHYFEWEKRGKEKIMYAIAPADAGLAGNAPRGSSGLLMIAGVYRIDPQTRQASFVILTRAAAEGIAFIHDRMPAILPASIARAWLDPNNDPREVLTACATRLAYKVA